MEEIVDEIYLKYIDCCKDILNDKKTFYNFKRDSRYNEILEHVSENLGQQYLSELIKNYEEYLVKIDWKFIRKNDYLGLPIKYQYNDLSKYVELPDYSFSPTTFRYLLTGFQIIDHIISLGISDKKLNFVEIGCGYAGQLYILSHLVKIFSIQINKYTCVDLKYPSLVQEKYLKKMCLETNFECSSIENLKIDDQIDFFISNYALSCIDIKSQNFYINKIIKKSEHGFIIWNKEVIHPFFSKFFIKSEIPQTGFANKVILY
ncbi:Hypothetical protein KVN_LOCUS83 [uncultured virus]|nr:Hypothetical protein KVN_LOCUS83 [uncultured virus]